MSTFNYTSERSRVVHEHFFDDGPHDHSPTPWEDTGRDWEVIPSSFCWNTFTPAHVCGVSRSGSKAEWSRGRLTPVCISCPHTWLQYKDYKTRQILFLLSFCSSRFCNNSVTRVWRGSSKTPQRLSLSVKSLSNFVSPPLKPSSHVFYLKSCLLLWHTDLFWQVQSLVLTENLELRTWFWNYFLLVNVLFFKKEYESLKS